ncbi:MAG: hypothetical protein BGO34_02425 [Bacteroidia bacterium 44-10]|nr:MAG: hypothetical protein BGO34_02425 [Bacteroidia bacterium 44-10]
MKKSKYNFIIPHTNDKFFLFNAASFHFFSMKNEQLEFLNRVLEDPDKHKSIVPTFYSNLIGGNFIVDESENEEEYIKRKNKESVESKHYKLIILPTFECNFSCWYCVQKHEKSRMSDIIIEKVKEHIRYMIERKHIHSLNIEWFGGEPFVYFDEIVYPISKYAKALCNDSGIPFYCCATTNGYLMPEETIQKMKEIELNALQITLDGSKEFHDKIRFSSDQNSSFEKILHNINRICDENENAQIIIRINYDDKNFEPHIIIEQIKNIIPERNRHSLQFRIRKVWQVKRSPGFREKIIIFNELARNNGFRIENSDIFTNFISCYVCKKYYNTIGPNGGIYKCTARENYLGNSWGILQKKGSIKWKVPGFEKKYFNKPLFENSKCEKCKYLPLCMGPCPYSFEESGLTNTSFKCNKLRTLDLKFEDSILEYCLNHNEL